MPARLAQHLIEQGLVTAAIASEALRTVERRGGTLDSALLELEAISEKRILQAMERVSGIRHVDLSDFETNATAAALMTHQVALQLNAVPLSIEENEVHIALGYPISQSQLRKASYLIGRAIVPWCATEVRIKDWQSILYETRLDRRYVLILQDIDVERSRATGRIPSSTDPRETYSPDVIQRFERGLVDVPILLTRVKAVPAAIEPDETESSVTPTLKSWEEKPTSMLDAALYARFAEQQSKDALEITLSQTRLIEPAAYQSLVDKTRDAGIDTTGPIDASETDFSNLESLGVPDIEKPPTEPAISDDVTPIFPQKAISFDGERSKPHAWTGASIAVTPGSLLTSAPDLKLPSEWTLAEARAEILNPEISRDQLVQLILRFARRTFDFASIFALNHGHLQGWAALGSAETPSLRDLSISLEEQSVFRAVALAMSRYVGPVPNDAETSRAISAMGQNPHTIVVWPIEIQSKLVAMIYGDCSERALSEQGLSEFMLFCQEIPTALTAVLLQKKQSDRRSNGAADTAALAQAFPGPTAWTKLPIVDLPSAEELGPIALVLTRLGREGAKAVAEILRSPDDLTRYLGLLTAGHLPFDEVVPGVVSNLFDFDSDVASAARAAAAALKHVPSLQTHIEVIRGELMGADRLKRSLAARALGTLRDRKSIPTLIDMVGSIDAMERYSAHASLKEISRADFGLDASAWQLWWNEAQTQRRAEWLVLALSESPLELRRSAIDELSAAQGTTLGYHAHAPAPEREESIDRWMSLLAARPDFDV